MDVVSQEDASVLGAGLKVMRLDPRQARREPIVMSDLGLGVTVCELQAQHLTWLLGIVCLC